MAWPTTTDAITVLGSQCSATFVMRPRDGVTNGFVPYAAAAAPGGAGSGATAYGAGSVQKTPKE